MLSGTIETERTHALLFKPDPLGDFKPAAVWIPRSIVTRISRDHAGTPTAASIRLPGWKVAQLGWRDLDDE